MHRRYQSLDVGLWAEEDFSPLSPTAIIAVVPDVSLFARHRTWMQWR